MMSRWLLAIALLALAAAPAAATVGEACCACLPIEKGTTSGPMPPTQALFCGEFPDTAGPGEECDQLGGSLLCIRQVGTTNAPISYECLQQLAGENIACPSAERAPVAGAGMLVGLAALLGLAGVATLRRAR